MELVIASTNVHKVREYRTLLKSFGHFDILSLLDFPHYVPPYETGTTFEENAHLKAEHAAQALGKLVLADDSGLVVPALKGAPGVFSARYSGENASDPENCKKLLREMKDLQEADRYAYLECFIVLAFPGSIRKHARGVCEGFILEHTRGRNGFGYDSLFMKHEYSKTFAELEEDTKNRISHRRKAFDKISLFLESLREDAVLDRRL